MFVKLWLTICICGWYWLAPAQLAWVTNDAPQILFAGRPQQVRATILNTGTNTVQQAVRSRLYQLSSATAMPVAEGEAWKTLVVLGGQTINENKTITLPDVKTPTAFAMLWQDATGSTLGRTEIMACPSEVLRGLSSLAGGGDQLAVWDPSAQITPVLEKMQIGFQPLANGAALKQFAGKVAILVPAVSMRDVSAGEQETVRARVRDGLSVVWLHPAARQDWKLISSHATEVGEGMVVAAPAASVANLATSPESQLNLLALVETALRRKGWQLATNTP